MKKRLKKFFVITIISICCFLGVSCLNVEASSVDKEFHEFEIGQTFPVGYSITLDNSNGVVPSKEYVFNKSSNIGGSDIVVSVYVFFNGNNKFEYYVKQDGQLYIETQIEDSFYFTDFGIPLDDSEWELVSINVSSGSGELGIYTDIVPIDPEENYIYNGVYNLLGNMIYGSIENLNSSAIGTLTFFSTLITLLCVLLPFIILFFIVRKLCD